MSDMIGPNQRMIIYLNLVWGNDMPQWPGGISIDDVAKAIGKFEPGSKMTNGPYFQATVYGIHFPQELGKVSIPIKYWRDTLSYGNSFKYRDRFKMIGKLKIGKSKVEDLLSETDIKLAAECNLNTDIILMWTQRGVYLLYRKDFEEALVKIMNILNNKTDESLEEDTVKTSDGKWVNKGKEGTHGKFKTKKAADEQRKAMFANGYHENLTVEEDKEAFENEFGDKQC